MVEVTKIGNKTLVVDGKIMHLFKQGSVLRRMWYGGYDDFDNANGGVWKKYIHIPITQIPLEDAIYSIIIDSTNVSVYNASGTLKTQSAIANEFWSLAKIDGFDIRVFDEMYNQLWFWLCGFDYVNKSAIIWVKIPRYTQELNIAFGNNLALKSMYDNPNNVLTLFRYDPFTTLDTSFWTHREKYVSIDTSQYVSPPSSLRLYYDTGTPWHADCGASLPLRSTWIMDYYWKNRGTDRSNTSDPDRGGGFLCSGGVHGSHVLGNYVFLDKIDYVVNNATVRTEYGEFYNIWLHFRNIYFNGGAYIYREEGNVWRLKYAASITLPNIDAVRFVMTGYYHEEFADDLYLYTIVSGDPAMFGSPLIMEF